MDTGECGRYRNTRYANADDGIPPAGDTVSRPRGDHRERRAAIAFAAAEVIASRGLDRLTMRTLAAELGVTTGVLTHYFPSKDALLRHTKDLAFDRTYASARAAAEGPPGMERLHAVVEAVLPLDRERRVLWRLLVTFFGSAVGSPPLRQLQARRMQRWYRLYEDVVTPLKEMGELPANADPARIAKAIALFVEGMSIHVVMNAPVASAQWQRDFAREQVRRLVTG